MGGNLFNLYHDEDEDEDDHHNDADDNHDACWGSKCVELFWSLCHSSNDP